jgi:hypothetical protein
MIIFILFISFSTYLLNFPVGLKLALVRLEKDGVWTTLDKENMDKKEPGYIYNIYT